MQSLSFYMTVDYQNILDYFVYYVHVLSVID